MQAAIRSGRTIYFGIAATSLATLVLELALTRVFSVVYFYHFAFLAISIALFGSRRRGRILLRGRGLARNAVSESRHTRHS